MIVTKEIDDPQNFVPCQIWGETLVFEVEGEGRLDFLLRLEVAVNDVYHRLFENLVVLGRGNCQSWIVEVVVAAHHENDCLARHSSCEPAAILPMDQRLSCHY
jgi:hypothetical protein